jgi:hypothetical protein
VFMSGKHHPIAGNHPLTGNRPLTGNLPGREIPLLQLYN